MHCTNINHQQIQDWSKEFSKSPEYIGGIVSLWQESNNRLDEFPSKLWMEEQIKSSNKEGVKELFDSNSEFAAIGTPEQYSQYLEQNPNGSVEQFKSWVDEFNKNNKLLQESGSLTTISKSKIDNLQNTVEYQLLNEKDEDLDKKTGQSYVFLSEKDAQRFTYLVERNKEFPKEFEVTKKITKYEKDSKNPLKFNSYNEYVDFYYIKSNKNKKSNLYNIVNKETGEVIASKVRVLSVSKDSKSEIAKKYGLEHTPTKVFSANRSIAFTLYRQKPSKAKYIAQAKKYLYDAIKFLNPDETSLKINLDKIEELLSSFPEEMWDYINTTYSPEDSTNINASISLQNEIKFKLPKLGFLQEIEKITGIPLQGVSFKNYDRTGSLAKVFKFSKLDGEWGSTITIDNSMTTKELKASIRYYLSTKNIFKQTSEEENVRKYAEHRGIDYDKLKELVFGDIDKALDNIAYNQTGNSDTIELSKWRESIRNYDWQSAELFSKPYENFQNTVKERIITKFKDKKLSNGISHLEYFFNSGSFNWLNINFNNISGQYYLSDMETEANVGVETKMGGIINPFEMKIYQKPKAGENFLQEKEIFNRLAAVLHEPFHALHALSYGTKEELELRKAFDNLYNTAFGKEMMNQVFGSGYNKGQQISYDTLYKEFTAFTTQLMLYPKQWIKNTDLRSNDIYEFIEKIQTLQDKTYEEIVKTQQKIGTTEKTITEEEKIKLSFLEKLYNYLVKGLNKIIPLSKKFTNLIVDSKLVEKKVIEDVFGEVEETVTKTLKLPDNVKKSKEQFLEAMEELQSAINTLMQIDGKLFSSENITNFFTSNKFNQEQRSLSNFISQKSQKSQDFQQFQQSLNKPNTNPILQGNQQEQVKKFAELQERLNNKEFLEGAKNAFESSEELQQFGTQEQYNDYIARVSLGIIKNPSSGEYNYESKVRDIVYHGTDALSGKSGIDKEGFKKPNRDRLLGGKNQIGIFFTDKENASNFSKDLQVDLAEQAANRFEDTLPDEYKEQLRNTSKPILIPAIINASNPINLTRHELQKQWENLPNKVNSVLVTDLSGKYGYEKVVFEPEQIHILLSKEDIQGFKEFVQGEKDDLNPFIDESNKIGEQIRDVEDNIQFSLSPEINYQLKAIEILNSDKAKQVFDKGRKNNWTLNKVLDEIGGFGNRTGYKNLFTEEQLSSNVKNLDREQLSLDIASDYSYTVEINTAKTNYEQTKSSNPFEAQYNFLPISEEEFKEKINIAKENGVEINREDRIISFTLDNIDYQYVDGEFEAWDKNKEKIKKGENTQYYSNLTVPGGTNGSYREQNFETPLIKVPKSHAQFNTENTIGFSRNDDRQVYVEKDINSLLEIMQKSGILEVKC